MILFQKIKKITIKIIIKINNNITLVIIEIVIEKGLEIYTFLPLRSTDFIKPFFSLKI